MGECARRGNWKRIVWLGLPIMLMAGIVYERVGEYMDAKAYPPAGKMVSVNGRSMHVFAQGKGWATVVCSSGWKVPSPYVDFYPLYKDVAKHSRIVVYDRPGYGWSEATSEPRYVDTIAREMHEALAEAGEKPPYVLVGHSMGALEVVRFAQLYGKEVKGVLLMDGSNPDMYVRKAPYSPLVAVRAALFNWSVYAMNRIGLTRLLFRLAPTLYEATPLATARNNLEPSPPHFKGLDAALFLKTFNNRNQVDEGKNKESNATTVASHGRLGNLPLKILTSEEMRRYPEAWKNQEDLKGWSMDSAQTIVPNAGHAIHWTHPETVNREIISILNQ